MAFSKIAATTLSDDIISGKTALAEAPADTDELLLSDAGTLKRIDYSHIKDGAGAFVKLSTVDLSSGDSLAAFDSSIITTTYKQYFFTFTNLRPTDDNSYLKMQESTNNGSSFLANDCDWHFQFQYTSQTNTEYLSNSGANQTDCQLSSNHVGNGTMEGISGQLFYSRDGANPSKGNWGIVFTNSNYVYYQNGGFYRDDASATNYVRFQMGGSTFISGRITCYGITT